MTKKILPWSVNKKYPYEAVPGHNVSPARYCFQRKMWDLLVKKKILSPKDKLILDFGCGPGNYRMLFTGKKYVGFDILPTTFYKWQQENTHFLTADGTATPFKDESFDFVFSNAVLEHIPDNYAAARESARVLKKGKRIVVIVPTRMSIIYDEIPFIPLKLLNIMEGHADHYYSKKELKKVLQNAGFKIQKMSYSMGFFSALLKTIYVYSRFPRYLFYNAIYKLFHKETGKRGLYSDTKTVNARNRDELFRMQKKEYMNISVIQRIYRKMLELCYYLDEKIRIPAGGEWLVIAKRIR